MPKFVPAMILLSFSYHWPHLETLKSTELKQCVAEINRIEFENKEKVVSP